MRREIEDPISVGRTVVRDYFRRKLRWRWEESPLIALLLPPTGHASSLLDFDSTLRLPARRRVNRAKPTCSLGLRFSFWLAIADCFVLLS